MKHLLPLLLLASCEPIGIIHDDITGSGPDWGEGTTNPDLGENCTHKGQDYGEGEWVYFQVGDTFHWCDTLDSTDENIIGLYPTEDLTLTLEARTYGYSTARIIVGEYPEDLPNAIKNNQLNILDIIEVDGYTTREYQVSPSPDAAYLLLSVETDTTSNFNDYYLRIEHGL